MTTKQSRKAVSISGATYAKVQAHCQEQGMSISGFVEMLVAEFFRNNTSDLDAAPPKKEKKEKKEVEEKEPPAKPFTPSGLKKDPVPVVKDTIRGGGVHSL